MGVQHNGSQNKASHKPVVGLRERVATDQLHLPPPNVHTPAHRQIELPDKSAASASASPVRAGLTPLPAGVDIVPGFPVLGQALPADVHLCEGGAENRSRKAGQVDG